jgi:hypothetical protein
VRCIVVILCGLALAASAGTALGVVATPISPSAGQAIVLTPPAGFANADIGLTWSITFDCPGPASIHGSSAQRRLIGTTDWQAQGRDGPFDGDGVFTTPASFFPVAAPAAWEWRVFWACGATLGFEGSQGVSEEVPFTVTLGGAAPPTPITPQPAPVATPPCASLTGRAKALCRAKLARTARLKSCSRIGKAKPRAACRVRARALYTRTVRLQACAKKAGKKKVACVRNAKAAYRRAVS